MSLSWQISVTGTTDVPVFDMGLAELSGDYSPIESCLVHITDGFRAETDPEPTFGRWEAHVISTGEVWSFLDIHRQIMPVSIDDCYQGITGIMRYPTLDPNPLFLVLGETGFVVIDCFLPTESMSFSGVKRLYR